MKLCHICECCDKVFKIMEIDGEGAAEIPGLCEDCAREIRPDHSSLSLGNRFYYN